MGLATGLTDFFVSCWVLCPVASYFTLLLLPFLLLLQLLVHLLSISFKKWFLDGKLSESLHVQIYLDFCFHHLLKD